MTHLFDRLLPLKPLATARNSCTANYSILSVMDIYLRVSWKLTPASLQIRVTIYVRYIYDRSIGCADACAHSVCLCYHMAYCFSSIFYRTCQLFNRARISLAQERRTYLCRSVQTLGQDICGRLWDGCGIWYRYVLPVRYQLGCFLR